MKIDLLLKKGVTDGVFPGAVFLVARADEILFFESVGQANLLTGTPVAKETVFDLASLTKPLATTLVMMYLVQIGQVTLTTRIAEILSPFDTPDKNQITIEHLLCHTSGYPAYQPYFKELMHIPGDERLDRLKTLLVNEFLLAKPGVRMCYSDLGFMILAWIIETLCNKTLPAVVREKIYQPLGLETLFFPDCQPLSRVVEFAATEDCPWRKQTLVGTVHDDNAGAVKGLLGHAGLFGDAQSVYELLRWLMQAFHREASLAGISTDVVRQFFTPCKTGGRVKGFDTPNAVDSASGRYFSKKSVGHLGLYGNFLLDGSGKPDDHHFVNQPGSSHVVKMKRSRSFGQRSTIVPCGSSVRFRSLFIPNPSQPPNCIFFQL